MHTLSLIPFIPRHSHAFRKTSHSHVLTNSYLKPRRPKILNPSRLLNLKAKLSPFSSPKWPSTEKLYRGKSFESTKYGKSQTEERKQKPESNKKPVLCVANGNGSLLKPARAAKEKIVMSFPLFSAAWAHSVPPLELW